MSDTHPNALKAEAMELRRQARILLDRADTLDPPEEKPPRRKIPEGQSVLNRWRRKEPQPGEVDDV